MTLLASIGMSLALISGIPAQDGPVTKAEATNYAQTSSYGDVVEFLRQLMASGPPMRLEWIGKSPLGKELPLVVVAKNPAITPLQAKAEGKLVVYIQANIHAGEVEGKEASLMLLREIASKPNHPYLQRMVLLVNPIYNSDGNDRWGPLSRNRPSQDGPDPIGERANGQGFDLNRDCMKAESNEMRALLEHVYIKWDPEVIIDLHTTNGTRHNFVLTYSPPLNPTTDAGVLKYSRDELLPRVRGQYRRQFGQDLFDYGNASRREGAYRWETFEEYPRYVTNYAGIRNRVGILSEAASFQPFKTRVEATLRFVHLLLQNLDRDSRNVVDLCRKADQRMTQWGSDAVKAPELGIRFEMKSRGSEKVQLEKPNPDDPVGRGKAPKYFETVEMPVFDRFAPVRTAKLPYAYVFPESGRAVAELLDRHGVLVERLAAPARLEVQHFRAKEVAASPQPFQGRRMMRIELNPDDLGARTESFEQGVFLVRTSQPLGLLVFHMLEPESLDSAFAWGFFGEQKPLEVLPVSKVMAPFQASTQVFSRRSWR
jgi:hypothetical protein